MTGEYGCIGCEGAKPVTWLLTHLSPPATISTCEEDFEPAVVSLLATRLGVDAGWLTHLIMTSVEQLGREAEAANDQAADAIEHPDDAEFDNDSGYPVVTDE